MTALLTHLRGMSLVSHLLFAAIFDISIQIPDLMMSCSICVGGGASF